jgi:hypothetical protein
MNICVFCSASDIDEKYDKPAAEFARLVAESGHTLIWGGSDRGTMKTIASAAQRAGGRIVGISMKLLEDRARKNADEMVIAASLDERKKIMSERADAFVALPGGIGTLDEITHILELKKHSMLNKPVVFLNTNNFYGGFKQQMERMKKEAFISRPLEELVYFATTPQEALSCLER